MKEQLERWQADLGHYGLDGWRVKVDQRFCRVAGKTYHAKKEIRLAFVCWLCRVDLDKLWAHELAHAIVGPGHYHDSLWAAVCQGLGGYPSATIS